MRASCTHNRRTYRNVQIGAEVFFFGQSERFCNRRLRKFADTGKHLFSDDVKSDIAAVAFNNAVQFFNYIQFFHFCSKIFQSADGQGMDKTKLENADTISKYFFYILIRSAGGNNTDVLSAHFNAIVRTVFRKFRQSGCTRFNKRMAALSIAGHHNILCTVFDIGFFCNIRARICFNDALRVRDARTHTKQNRRVKFFRQFKRFFCKEQSFRRICGFEHRYFSCNGVVAGVLFVLRRVHTRIVCNTDHKTGIYTGIGKREQRVCSDIQPYVLHSAAASGTRERCAECDLHRYFFIRRPFTVYFFIICGKFRNLGAGSARITGDDATARFI